MINQFTKGILGSFYPPKTEGMNMKKKRINGGEKFIGREVQLAELRKVLNSERPEFVAVYGRRRVGKTFMIREAAGNDFTFYYTAANNVSKRDQLANFALVLKNYSKTDSSFKFKNWFEAFNSLGDFLDSLPKNKNKKIFFDEMPWADSPKSGFLAAFENFWNVRCAFKGDIKVIVCGSATSWILNKIIHNRGGLYGRLTHVFKVEPFNLWETELYFKAYGYKFSQMQIAEIYMILGGIPYYFSLLEKGESVVQNIDRLFFSENAPLKKEFEVLYSSLYRNPAPHIDVIMALSKKGKGLTRQELIDLLKTGSNGSFSRVLKELEEGGFIRAYYPFESSRKNDTHRKNIIFQLVDLFSLFYLKYGKESKLKNTGFWAGNYKTPQINAWRGFAFEMLCLWHVPQIKEALGIRGISANVCSWIGKNEEGEKAQIDLLIDRKDGVVNICEMKWGLEKYTITKKYAEEFENKLSVFLAATKTKKIPVGTFITTNGVKFNQYIDLAQVQVELKQLFKY